jgi:hypothetical protein
MDEEHVAILLGIHLPRRKVGLVALVEYRAGSSPRDRSPGRTGPPLRVVPQLQRVRRNASPSVAPENNAAQRTGIIFSAALTVTE